MLTEQGGGWGRDAVSKMQLIAAKSVDVSAEVDLDYGEGSICFIWDDELYGHDLLAIDCDGHCSRRRSVDSGNGPPAFVNLSRDRLRLRFDPALARKLKLGEEVEITFSVSDETFRNLAAVVARLSGDDQR